MRSLRPLALLLLLAACTSAPVRGAGPDEARACIEAYAAIDRAVERAEVRDAEAHRVAGFPYLRISRFLADFRERTLDDAAFAAWVDRMARLDQEGRAVELRNLSAEERHELDAAVRAVASDRFPGAAKVLAECPPALRQNDLGTADGRRALVAAAEVPDDYSMLARTMGLYPLSAIPVAMGYERWQRWNLPAFEVPVGQEDFEGTPVLFTPSDGGPRLSFGEVRDILERAGRNPLRMPEPEGEDLQRLAHAFAPALLIDVASADDWIGQPVWATDGLPAVEPARPIAFVRLAHAWFEGRPVLQLVYLFWFDARPRTSVFDLLGGRLDGLVWRVTLGPDGRPVVYDTIHACGCYHLFFPSPGTRALPVPENEIGDPRDPILVPASAEVEAPHERALVRVAAGSHYVTGVVAAAGHDADVRTETYTLVIDPIPDLQLRSMPTPGGGWRSLYGPDGIIRGTERSERVLLWPMGILEPGAMRQWGRHATAFVGQRHFDDPFLIERAFAR